jgi:hypothetical protein
LIQVRLFPGIRRGRREVRFFVVLLIVPEDLNAAKDFQ